MGILGFPRNITWPAGFTLILFALALLFTFWRRRSELWAALRTQFWVGAIVMLLATALIALMLPAGYEGPQI